MKIGVGKLGTARKSFIILMELCGIGQIYVELLEFSLSSEEL